MGLQRHIARYLKKLWTDLDETWWTGWVCDKDELMQFWWDPDPGRGMRSTECPSIILCNTYIVHLNVLFYIVTINCQSGIIQLNRCALKDEIFQLDFSRSRATITTIMQIPFSHIPATLIRYSFLHRDPCAAK